jgi:hypothetical protein
MRPIKLALTILALLLTACMPSVEVWWPTSTSESPTATTVNTPATTAIATTTPIVVVQAPPTEATIQATPTQANVATATSIASSENVTVATSAPTITTAAATPAGVAAAVSQEQGYENLTSPVDLLSSYYDAINLQEYERAYSYWQEPPLDYASFASGYVETASVQVIVQPPTRIEGAAGSLYVEIPAVLIAQHTDGSVHTFAGCVVTRKSNLPAATPEEDVWHIYQARLAEVANNAAIPALLDQGCAS